MVIKWIKVYDLAQDKELLAKIQKATLNTDNYGFVSEIALFGSEEWWSAIKKGLIPKYEIFGTISRIYMSGHNDWPEFEIDSGREKTSWTRVGNDEFYKVGSKVKLEYVIQKAKKSWTGIPYQKKVLSVYIKED